MIDPVYFFHKIHLWRAAPPGRCNFDDLRQIAQILSCHIFVQNRLEQEMQFYLSIFQLKMSWNIFIYQHFLFFCTLIWCIYNIYHYFIILLMIIMRFIGVTKRKYVKLQEMTIQPGIRYKRRFESYHPVNYCTCAFYTTT